MRKAPPHDCAAEHTHSGLEQTLEVIGDKWTIAIIHSLIRGHNRFGLLRKALVGISPKTLTVRLRKLEARGIIAKKVFPEVPLHIEYSLTDEGKSLGKVIRAMDEWGNGRGIALAPRNLTSSARK